MEPIIATNVLGYLQGITQLTRETHHQNPPWPYTSIEEFVLKNGRHFLWQPLPKGIQFGKYKECFYNAFQLASRYHKFIYVEGYALFILPMFHAWCIMEDGTIVDPTWREQHNHNPEPEYYGVPFSLDYVLKTVGGRKRYGVIDNWEHHFPLLSGRDTNFLSQRIIAPWQQPLQPNLGEHE